MATSTALSELMEVADDLHMMGYEEMSNRVKGIHVKLLPTTKSARKKKEPEATIVVTKTQRGETHTVSFTSAKDCEKYLTQEKKANDASIDAFIKANNIYKPLMPSYGSNRYQEYQAEAEKYSKILRKNGFDLHIEISQK